MKSFGLKRIREIQNVNPFEKICAISCEIMACLNFHVSLILVKFGPKIYKIKNHTNF